MQSDLLGPHRVRGVFLQPGLGLHHLRQRTEHRQLPKPAVLAGEPELLQPQLSVREQRRDGLH